MARRGQFGLRADGIHGVQPGLHRGGFVGAGDLNGNGRAEVITGPGAGGEPHVRVWSVAPDGAVSEVAGFLAYAPAFTGGVHVATADVDGNGRAEIVTGAGPGGGPHVETFSVQGPAVIPGLSFFAYDPAFTGGVFVAGAP